MWRFDAGSGSHPPHHDKRSLLEAFLDGHVSAFAFFGGIPQSILYDNTKLAVARICGDGKRERTRAFSELISHYLFRDRFGRPGKGNDTSERLS
jgi:transposase